MDNLISNCVNYIDEHVEDKITVESLAREFGYSKHHFSRLFSSQMGVSLREYLIEKKLMKAANEIIEGKTVLHVAIKYGYDTHNGFGKAFKKRFGYSPSILIAISLTVDKILCEGGNAMLHIELYDRLMEQTEDITSEDQKLLLSKVYEFIIHAHDGRLRYSGEEYVTHPLNVALILAEMHVPIETIVLGLLHDCTKSESNTTLEEVKNVFGIAYCTKLKRINELNLSKNLLKEVDFKEEEDVILVKLADRLHNMQTLKHLNKDRWEEKALETLSIFSPLAEKTGNLELKARLDGLSIKFKNE